MRTHLRTRRRSVIVLLGALLVFGLTTTLRSRRALIANAGPDQSGVFVGNVVNLSGLGSVGATSYAWTFDSRPTGSAAVLLSAATATPTFVPDKRGTYTVRLTVGDGTGAAPTDTVVITTANRPPIANAGPDLTGQVGDTVLLVDGGSSDPDADKITYKWTVVSAPPASLGRLKNPTKAKASLVLDRPGAYVVELVVRDGLLSSAPDLAIVTTSNSAPDASAGPDRKVTVGTPVQLDGAGSADIDEDTLTYAWTLNRPAGSSAVLDDPASPMPAFTPDRAGSYTAKLTVSDGTATSKDAVILATTANRPPVARAGADDRTLAVGDTIQLDATDSTDANGQLLSYAWTLTKKPSGSTTLLANPATPRPTFTADKKGKYTFSLVTTDAGVLTSSDSRLFSIPLPVAAAGHDQVVEVGATVALDGSASSHLGGTLAFGWALIAKPAGSAAALDDPADPQPHFVADVAGIYIAQLIMFDGVKFSPADTVVISTGANLPPLADLGPNQLVTTGVPVLIDATATDPNDDALTFSWALLGRPAGSTASLSVLSGTPTQLVPDVPGDYVVQLIATDPGGLASLDTLLLTTGNTRPSVDAGADRDVATDAPVALDAVVSNPSGGPVTYDWRILSGPAGADLDNPATDSPTFTADADGVYVVQVVVHDANNLAATDAVVIRATAGGPGPDPLTLVLSPKTASVPSGGSTVLTVTASAVVASNLQVNLSSSNASLLGVPPIVTILAGQASANFNATAAGGSGGAIVTASAAGAGTAKATVAVGARLVQWTDNVSGNWSDATKWTDDIAPGPGDVVVIDRPAGEFVITVNAPTAGVQTLYSTEELNVPSTLTINGHAAIDGGLVLTSQLNGAGSVRLGGPFTWTSGAISLAGGLEVAAGRTLTIETASDHGLFQTSLRNHGTVQWAGGQLIYQGGNITVVNESDGTWNAAGANLSMSLSTQPFTNAGLLRKTGTGQLTVGATWTNTGTIDVDAGSLAMSTGQLTNSGVIDMAAGTTLNAHLMTFANGTTLAGTGTMTMPGTTTVTATNLNLTLPAVLTSVLTGPGKVTQNAPFTWTSGAISLAGGLEVAAGRTLTIETASDHGLFQTSLRNHGTVQWTGGQLIYQGGNITVVNESDGTWNAAGANLSMPLSTQPFTNAGLLRKTGTGQLTVGATWTNTGTIDVDAGSLAMSTGQLTNSGVIDMAAGTTLNAHLMTFANGTTLAGTGTMTMPGTTTVTATNLNLTLPAVLTSVLTGPGKVTQNAPFTWTSGAISLAGGLEVAAGRTLTIETASDHGLFQTSLRNHGTVQWTGGQLIYQGGNITVVNESDGTWNAAGANLSMPLSTQPFTNAGLLRKTGTGQLTVGATWTNTGTIDVDAGSLAMSTGQLTNSGVIDMAAGTTLNAHLMTFANGTTLAGTGTMTMPGTTTVTATNLNLTLPAVLTSVLTGPGKVTQNAPFTWTSGAISLAGGLEVAAGRTLTIETASDHGLFQTSLRNHGTVQWTGGQLIYQGGNITVVNESDGTWNAAGANLSMPLSTQPFTNAGLLRKTGTGQLTVGATWTNTGTIDVDAGSLAMSTGQLTNSGVIDMAAGTTLNAHLMTFANGTTLAGTGTMTMPGTTTVTATNLNLTLPAVLTSVLTGPGKVTQNAPFTWTSGAISLAGGLEVAAGRTLTIETASDHGLFQTSLRNHGTVQWTGGQLIYQGGNITVVNESDGTWNAAGANLSMPLSTQPFTNAGLLRKTGTGQLTVGATWTNTGTIDVDAGSLAMSTGQLTNSGVIDMAAGTTLNAHLMTFANGTTLAGTGTMTMPGTTTVTATNLNLTLPAVLTSVLTGPGKVTQNAPFTWTSGAISLAGGLEVAAGRTLTIETASDHGLFQTSLRNHGTVQWTGGQLVHQGGNVTVVNEADGIWNIAAGSFFLTGSSGLMFTNAGLLKGTGAATTTLTISAAIPFTPGTTADITIIH